MSQGREFESRHNILDGHFSHLFAVKIVMCVKKFTSIIQSRKYILFHY